MSLKDMIEEDNANVFFNQDEFAEEHNLNGTVCMAIIEGSLIKERSARAAENYGGMYGSTITVHVNKLALPEVPVQGENFRLDGKLYFIETCSEDMGILTIGLTGNEIGGGSHERVY